MNEKLKFFGKLGLQFAEQIFPAVKAVELAFGKLKAGAPGSEKLDAAVDFILSTLTAEEQIAGNQVLSPAAEAKLRLAISAQVAFLNQVKADHAKTQTTGGE